MSTPINPAFTLRPAVLNCSLLYLCPPNFISIQTRIRATAAKKTPKPQTMTHPATCRNQVHKLAGQLACRRDDIVKGARDRLKGLYCAVHAQPRAASRARAQCIKGCVIAQKCRDLKQCVQPEVRYLWQRVCTLVEKLRSVVVLR